MNSKNIFFIVIGLLFAIYMVPNVLMNNTGGISGVIKLVGIGGAVLAFLQPRIGIYIITLETCYLDYFKKLGTYYGVPSQFTVIEILSMSMLTVGMLWATMVVHVLFTRKSLSKAQVGLFIGVVAVSVMLLALGGGANSKALQDIVNGAGILGVIMAITLYYDNPREQMLKYARHVIFILLPWPIMGLYQYYVDYSEMDYWYSLTNLSITNKPLEYMSLRNGFKTPLGFGSSLYAFAVVGPMYGFSLWHAITFKKFRIRFIFMFLLCLTAILHTEARTAMLLPMLIILFYIVLKYKPAFPWLVVSGYVAFLTIIFSAEFLSKNWQAVNDAFVIEGYESRMTLLTLQARLVPLIEFQKIENWSAFGIASAQEVKQANFGDRLHSHNFLTKILYVTGLSGVLCLLAPLLFISVRLIKFMAVKRDELSESMTRYGVAYLIPFVALNLLGGTGISTQPTNIMTTLVVGLLVCGCIPDKTRTAHSHS